ncbi:MAG TPA: hypothetical protein VEH04_11860 [Verrucomicrobiae bacterium]|nr:hypothetical protein [Verrucomicrobiae bacterium]
MSRRLQIANLAGVAALAFLCVLQWRRDRAMNLEVNRLEKIRIAGEQTIEDQEKALKGLTSDLALFKEQVTTARGELAELRDKERSLESDNHELLQVRAQLRESITNWIEAVKIRDERLVEANTRIQDLAERLNDSIRKYNELATNYNQAVTNLAKLQGAARQ